MRTWPRMLLMNIRPSECDERSYGHQYQKIFATIFAHLHGIDSVSCSLTGGGGVPGSGILKTETRVGSVKPAHTDSYISLSLHN